MANDSKEESKEGKEEREVISPLQRQINAQEALNQAEWDRRMDIYLRKQERVSKKSK